MYFCSIKMLIFPAAYRKIMASIEKKFVFSYIVSILISFHIKIHTRPALLFIYRVCYVIALTFIEILDRNF